MFLTLLLLFIIYKSNKKNEQLKKFYLLMVEIVLNIKQR